LIIGKFCSIGDEVVVFLGGNHRTDWENTYPFPALNEDWPDTARLVGHPATKGNVVIGNDVWIGYGATILSGVRIGDGAVGGARTADLELTLSHADLCLQAGLPDESRKSVERILLFDPSHEAARALEKRLPIRCKDYEQAFFLP
jgi:hypothetical protein